MRAREKLPSFLYFCVFHLDSPPYLWFCCVCLHIRKKKSFNVEYCGNGNDFNVTYIRPRYCTNMGKVAKTASHHFLPSKRNLFFRNIISPRICIFVNFLQKRTRFSFF